MKNIYLTSTLHNEWNTNFNPIICSKLEEKGFTVFLPQRDTDQKGLKENIWKEDIAGMDNAEKILAIANNETVNWGAEVGYAHGKGMKVIALTTKDHFIPLITFHMFSKILRVDNLDVIDGYINELIELIKST